MADIQKRIGNPTQPASTISIGMADRKPEVIARCRYVRGYEGDGNYELDERDLWEIHLGGFVRLTRACPPGNDLYRIEESGVTSAFGDITQSLGGLVPEEKAALFDHKREAKLDFPCSPAQLIEFVNGARGEFDLPYGFVRRIVENDLHDKKKAGRKLRRTPEFEHAVKDATNAFDQHFPTYRLLPKEVAQRDEFVNHVRKNGVDWFGKNRTKDRFDLNSKNGKAAYAKAYGVGWRYIRELIIQARKET